MCFQFFASSAQYDRYIVFTQTVPSRNVSHGFGKKVTAYQHIPVPFGQHPHKTLNTLPQFFCLVFCLRVCTAADTFPELIENEVDLAAAPLFRFSRIEKVKGKVAGDLRKEHPQHGGSLGRYRVPGMKPGVIDALLRILGVVQNIVGYRKAVRTVLICCF